MSRIDLEDLSEDECRIVAHFVAFVRRTRSTPDARAELLKHWEAIRTAPDVITPEEADALAAEAVAYVRANA